MTVSDWLKVCLGTAMFSVALNGLTHHLMGLDYSLDDQLMTGLVGAIIAICVCTFLRFFEKNC